MEEPAASTGRPTPTLAHQRPSSSPGSDGIERNVDPGDPCPLDLLKLTKEEAKDHGLVPMPMTLWDALAHLEGDDVLREGLGKTPDGDYVDYFVATKRGEVRSSQAEVTPWELEHYLSAI